MNKFTLALLKFMALDKLVASGHLRERLEFLFKNFVNQSAFFPIPQDT